MALKRSKGNPLNTTQIFGKKEINLLAKGLFTNLLCLLKLTKFVSVDLELIYRISMNMHDL